MVLVSAPWANRESGPTFKLKVDVAAGGLIFRNNGEKTLTDGDVLVAVTLSHVFPWLAAPDDMVTVIDAGVPTDGIIEDAGA